MSVGNSGPQSFKASVRAQWDQSAGGWDDHTAQIRAWLADATEAMLTRAAIGPGARVLDVAAGAGDQTLAIAQRVGEQGFVLATDLSPAILALARQRLDHAGYHRVATRVADGEQLPLEDPPFDAAVCRLGLMLFPDPLQGLREMHRALRPGGGIATLVFSRPENNPCIGILMSTALRHAGMPPRDPYQPGALLSLGKPGLLDALFSAAGFRDVATTVVQAPFRLPSASDYVHFVRSAGGPIQQILSGLAPPVAEAAWDEIAQRLDAFTTADGWVGPNELLLTSARR